MRAAEFEADQLPQCGCLVRGFCGREVTNLGRTAHAECVRGSSRISFAGRRSERGWLSGGYVGACGWQLGGWIVVVGCSVDGGDTTSGAGDGSADPLVTLSTSALSSSLTSSSCAETAGAWASPMSPRAGGFFVCCR